MDPLAEIKVTFFQECEEQLSELEGGLLAMAEGSVDSETVNAVFRAVHSVKGGAGAFGLDELVKFAHVFETTLDDVRAARLEPTADIVRVLLRAADVLADLVRAARGDGEVNLARRLEAEAELAACRGAGPDPHAAEPAPVAPPEDDLDGLVFTPLAVAPLIDDMAFAPLAAPPLAPLDAASEPLVAPTWRVCFRPHAALYAKANDAILLLRELGRLGPVTVTLDAGALPDLAAMDPEGGYLSWTAHVETAAGEAAVREVFEFVDGDCDIEIAPAVGEADPDAPEPERLAETADAGFDVAALLARVQTLAVEAPVAAPAPPSAARVSSPLSPAPAVAPAPAPALAPPLAAKAADAAAAPAAGKAEVATAPTTIRVDLERVDRLIDLVGELVINQAMLAQRVSEARLPNASAVAVGLDELEGLTREIQDSVMAIRAQPVKSVFQRIPRLVREVAAQTGKTVRLVTEGEGTEVDKTVIERLSDPLTHMIRNAIDHGLESPDKRLAAGKPAEGVVRLSAAHRSGRIIIEVADDGGGIHRPRVRQIAVDRGLIPPDAQLSDEETDNLIFLPGFSTASEVSDISGRGVGMDVVRRSIQALGGRISISSRPGLGSTFTMSLPLTLAVLDGMVVTVAGQTLVVPLTSIIETLKPRPGQVKRLGVDGLVVAIRDVYAPLIDVSFALGFRPQTLDGSSGVAILVECEGQARAALLVDDIQGQRQVVIKSLEHNYRPVDGVAAATILGDGRVALILDVDAVVSAASRGAAAHAQPLAPPLAPPLALAG